MHGVTHTLDEIRERGVPGFEVEVIGTDPHADRRLSAVAEVDVPFYAGMRVGVPSLPAVVEALSEGRYDVLHVCAPGRRRRVRPDRTCAPAADRGFLPHGTGRLHGAAQRGREARFRRGGRARRLLRRLRRRVVAFAGERRPAHVHGRGGGRRWARGVDIERFSPALRTREADGRVRALYAGRLD